MDRDETVRRLREATTATLTRERYRLVREDVPPPVGSEVLFLGTGGNPTNVVGQHRATGGFVVTLGGFSLFVDPGPGAIVHAVRWGAELRNLGGLFVSHHHTDHSQGAAAIVEAMCRGMTAHRGVILGSSRALDEMSPFHRGDEASRWYPGGPESVLRLAPGERADLAGGLFLSATPTHHAPDDVGFRLESPGLTLGYTSDTAYILSSRTAEGVVPVRPGETIPAGFLGAEDVYDDVTRAFHGVDVLILNVSFFHQAPHRHLTAFGAAELLRRVRPSLGVLTHFDPSVGSPAVCAEDAAAVVSDISGVPVLAASDGFRLDLVPYGGKRP